MMTPEPIKAHFLDILSLFIIAKCTSFRIDLGSADILQAGPQVEKSLSVAGQKSKSTKANLTKGQQRESDMEGKHSLGEALLS
jgi:hypothetical protein